MCHIQYNNKNNIRYKLIRFYLNLKSWLSILIKSIFYKDYRIYVLNSLADKNWYKEKLIQLGIKL